MHMHVIKTFWKIINHYYIHVCVFMYYLVVHTHIHVHVQCTYHVCMVKKPSLFPHWLGFKAAIVTFRSIKCYWKVKPKLKFGPREYMYMYVCVHCMCKLRSLLVATCNKSSEQSIFNVLMWHTHTYCIYNVHVHTYIHIRIYSASTHTCTHNVYTCTCRLNVSKFQSKLIPRSLGQFLGGGKEL